MMSDTAPIRPEERFDEAVVAGYLCSTLPELFSGPVRFDQFPGGAANLTYRAVDAEDREYVLRRAPLGAVVASGYRWGRDRRPNTPWHKTVIYEVHVCGFTRQHPDVPESLRGTYAGLASDAAIMFGQKTVCKRWPEP